MFTLRSAVCAVTLAFATIVKAEYNIDPDSVALSIRQSWCDTERSTCPIICQQYPPGTTKVNECDPATLNYGCLCGNNQQPNVSEYSLTLPYFICQEYGNQCVKACGQNNQCSSDCRQNHPCGATDPKRYNTTATVTTAAVTASPTSSDTIFSGSPGSDGSGSGSGSGSSAKNGASPAIELGRTYGLVVVLGSMFVGFALL